MISAATLHQVLDELGHARESEHIERLSRKRAPLSQVSAQSQRGQRGATEIEEVRVVRDIGQLEHPTDCVDDVGFDLRTVTAGRGSGVVRRVG